MRHGRTVMNRDVRFRGIRDVPLDGVGVREAWVVAGALAPIGLDAVYTSPLSRARNVAEAIARLAEVGDVRDDPLLINLDYGRWEGLTREEARARDPDEFIRYANDPETAICPGGESVSRAADRVMLCLQRIAGQHPGQSVAVVTHGVLVRLAVLRVTGQRTGDWQFTLPTGSATIFTFGEHDLELASTADRSKPHLQARTWQLHAPDPNPTTERRRLPDRRVHDYGAGLAVDQRRGPRRAEEVVD